MGRPRSVLGDAARILLIEIDISQNFVHVTSLNFGKENLRAKRLNVLVVKL